MAYDDADIRAFYNQSIHYDRSNDEKKRRTAIPRIFIDHSSKPVEEVNHKPKLAEAARISPTVVRIR